MALALDPTFNAPTGFILGPVGAVLSEIRLQPDEQIVAAGRSLGNGPQTVRYAADGTSFVTFNTAVLPLPFDERDLLLQADGKIVVLGIGAGGITLARYNPDGATLDPTFGVAGIVSGPVAVAFVMTLQADGRIVVTGFTGGNVILTVRYTTAGVLDTTFQSGPVGFPVACLVQPDGKVLVSASNPGAGFSLTLVRYTTAGLLDPTFNGTGFVNTAGLTNPSGLVLQRNGFIVAGYTGGDFRFHLARFDPGGTLDPLFGVAGLATGALGSIREIAVMFDQSFVAAGADPSFTGFLLQQFSATGVAGAVSATNAPGQGRSIAPRLDGRVNVGGEGTIPQRWVVARYTTGAPPMTPTAITFPAPGDVVASGPIIFTGTAQGPSNVYVIVDGVVVGGTATPVGTDIWAFVTALAPGPHTLQVVSTYQSRGTNLASPVVDFVAVICVHGSSRVAMFPVPGQDGESTRAIRDVAKGDTVLAADGRPALVTEALRCWLKTPSDAEHSPCLLLPAGSLAPDVPSSLLAIDPGHPVCTPAAFADRGKSALRPAGLHDAAGASVVGWDAVADMLPGDNWRYDLVLASDSCGAYIANGVVVQGRRSTLVPGYLYHD